MDQEEKTVKKKREIVVPGEIIVSGDEFLPGDGTERDGKDIVSKRYGLSDESGRLVKIIPLSGVFTARRGNVIIGRVSDLTFNGWLVDLGVASNGFLPLAECPRYINQNDMAEHFSIDDLMVAKISGVKGRGIDLTIKGRGLGKVEKGIIINVNSNKVPRIIGKEGSMISLIKEKSGCDITVGQNGLIWIKGNKIEDEILAKNAIGYIEEKPFIEGLTDKMEGWFKEEKK
ncbi:MAG: KH domain-containing protein [Nanoarchaeota archaeon]|nr:KH domain-containing protein [Nanoarchaeota archaeon]